MHANRTSPWHTIHFERDHFWGSFRWYKSHCLLKLIIRWLRQNLLTLALHHFGVDKVATSEQKKKEKKKSLTPLQPQLEINK